MEGSSLFHGIDLSTIKVDTELAKLLSDLSAPVINAGIELSELLELTRSVTRLVVIQRLNGLNINIKMDHQLTIAVRMFIVETMSRVDQFVLGRYNACWVVDSNALPI